MFSAITGIEYTFMVKKLFYRSMGTTGLNIWTRKHKEHKFSFLVRMISDSNYPKNRISITMVLNTLVLATRYFWHQQFALLSREVKVSTWAHFEQHSAHIK